MSVAWVVITDGRHDYLKRAVESFLEGVTGPVTERWMYDDTGDPRYRRRLAREFPDFTHLNAGPRQGFGGAIRYVWRHLAEHSQAHWVFHHEQDFTFTRPLDLQDMIDLSVQQPHLAQVALRRQPWGAEPRPGGFMAQCPECYIERTDGDLTWVETTRNWTTNPNLYRREIIEVGWPDDPHSEGHWGFKLRDVGLPWGVAGEDVRFGFLGSMDSGRDWAWHIGDQRVGTGY